MAQPDPFVRPLEDGWRPVLDAVLRRLGAPGLDDVARLAPRVAALSRSYNAGHAGDAPERGPLPLEARVAFSFARDVPKGAGAVAELVAAGLLAVPADRPLRVLDLGAGLGAMTWGLARALAATGAQGAIDALLVDEDEAALAAASRIHEAASREGALGLGELALAVRTRVARLGAGELPGGPFDLVVLGQVLSELDTTQAPEARVAAHAELVRKALGLVAPTGSVVVVEPALRARSRHLHAVRDALLAGAAPPVVFAPCLHARPCPALAGEGDWCHEDRAVDLPPWLVPLARAAGLRFQGLTFSYLVLRREGPALRDRLASPSPSPREGRVVLRVVSEVMPSKGKVELFACTEKGERLRLRRLDRDASEATSAWDGLGRGDVVSLVTTTGEPSIDERGRLSRVTVVDVHATRS